MWDGSDVIVAWKQNGRILDPDHGFPVGNKNLPPICAVFPDYGLYDDRLFRYT